MPLGEGVAQFRAIRDYDLSIVNRADLFANFFLYVPLGFFLTRAIAAPSHPAWRHVLAALIAAGVAACIAVGVEFVQLWFPPRTVSVNDIRAEIVGGAAGACAALVWRLAAPWMATLAVRVRRESFILRAGTLYVLILLAWSLAPYDVVLSGNELLAKLHSYKVSLVPFRDVPASPVALLKLGLHVLTFAPVGYWLAHALKAKKRIPAFDWRRIVRATSLGAGIALGIEVLQLAIFSRSSSSTSVILGACGAALGATISAIQDGAHGRRSTAILRVFKRRDVWIGACALYSVALVVLMLAPFRIVPAGHERDQRWADLIRTPFAAMYTSSEFDALTNVLHKGLVFAALGAGLYQAAAPPDSRGGFPRAAGLAIVGLAAALGVLIEIGQVFIAAHQPDLSDVLIYVAFAALGAGAMSRWRQHW
jgi:VanZ family protein